MVVELLSESDKDLRALAYEQIRDNLPGEAATRVFAAQLANLGPDAQVGLIDALAARGDPAALAAIADLLDNSPNEAVRLAAIESVGALGQATDCAGLVKWLASDSALVRQAARSSLVRLQGNDVLATLLQISGQAEPSVRAELVEILADRRAIGAIPHLQSMALDQDSQVRSAAMVALGTMATPEDLPGLVQGVLRAETPGERAAAEKSVMFVCNRIENAELRGTYLLNAMKTLTPSDRRILLSTLGRVGGPDALREVNEMIESQNQADHDAGVSALANWPDASAAPRLIEIVKQDDHESHQITAVRALIRIAPLRDGRNDAQKLQLLATAMEMTTRDRERLLALERAAAIRSPESLRFVLPYVGQPDFSEQACETIVELAHDRNLREANRDEFHEALDRVIAVSQDATVLDRAQRYKNNQTWVRPRRRSRR